MDTLEYVSDLSPELLAEIRRVVSREMASAGTREDDVTAYAGEDHDGEPAIKVHVRHRPDEGRFDAQAAAQALFSLNDMLHARGERRFGYIKHDEEEGV